MQQCGKVGHNDTETSYWYLKLRYAHRKKNGNCTLTMTNTCYQDAINFCFKLGGCEFACAFRMEQPYWPFVFVAVVSFFFLGCLCCCWNRLNAPARLTLPATSSLYRRREENSTERAFALIHPALFSGYEAALASLGSLTVWNDILSKRSERKQEWNPPQRCWKSTAVT